MTKETAQLTEVQKYEIDKKYEIQQQKLDSASSIKVGNETLASISMLAEKFSKAGDLIPKEFQGNSEKCFVAMYKGASLGLDAFTSLQRIAVVNGRATIWGDTALALVRNSGLLSKFEEELVETQGKLVARCIVKRKDEKEHVSEFSQQDAEVAKLWGSNVWAKYPKRMLKYRARAYALRDIFADVLDGLYLKEEMEGEQIIDVSPSPSSKTAAAHKAPPSLLKQDPQQPRMFEDPKEPENQIEMFEKQPAQDEEKFELPFEQEDVKAEEIFERVSKQLKVLTTTRAVNVYLAGEKGDVDYLGANKPEYFAEIQEIKNKQLKKLAEDQF